MRSYIAEQIRHKITFSEGEAKQSRVRSAMRWWTKRISMVIVIDKTASSNIAFKADMMSQAVLEAQTSFVTPKARGQESGGFVRATLA